MIFLQWLLQFKEKSIDLKLNEVEIQLYRRIKEGERTSYFPSLLPCPCAIDTGLPLFNISDGSWFSFSSSISHFSGYAQKRQSKGTKRTTRQAKALENARKAPRTFLELVHEVGDNSKSWLV